MAFSVTQVLKLPEQVVDVTTERLYGYDKLTGRLVLI
jgi:hypothetical protein